MSRYRPTPPTLSAPPPRPWPTLRVRPIAARKRRAPARVDRGCQGCGEPGHSVTTCYSAGAARYWEAAGDTRRAALVRRQLDGLERARGQITTVAYLAAARRTKR